jgi:hypothetical protein
MRDNKTRKNIKVGGFGWFKSKPKSDSPKSTVEPTPIEKIKNDSDLASKSILKNDPSKLQNKIKNSQDVLGVTAAMTAVASTAAMTGIGLPIAGLMGLLLLITNSMVKSFKFNLILRLLMQDATIIILDGYLHYDLIVKSYKILNTFNDPELPKGFCESNSDTSPDTSPNTSPNTSPDTSPDTSLNKTIRKFQINQIMQEQIKYQIELLIKELLMLSDSKTIASLMTDPTLQNAAFKSILESENAIREKEKKSWLPSMSKANRNFLRKFSSTRFIAEINNSLTVINSYMILLKSNMDLTIKKFEILSPDDYKNIWKQILCSHEYNAYIKPILSEALKEAGEDAEKLNPATLKDALDNIKIEDQSTSDNGMVKGGYKIKRRIKRKTMKK